jgi:murein DD-endopeptidase MepM/ murein hydrolase activator NlpD
MGASRWLAIVVEKSARIIEFTAKVFRTAAWKAPLGALVRTITAFFEDTGRFCIAQQHALLRLAVVLCLYGTLVLGFVQPGRGALLLATAQAQGMEAAQTGMGGGVYLGNATIEGQFGDEWPVEEGILEPESFSKPQMLLYGAYAIQSGDIIGDLAANFGLTQDTLISVNGIKNTRLIQIGQTLRVPNQDGILYTVKKGDTLEAIAEKYSSDVGSIQQANELFSDKVLAGTSLFLPGARLDWVERQEINGDLFIWPVAGYITSPYGYRRWPFGGGRQFHSGIDIGARMGTPVRAAMSGRVSSVGWDDVLGNCVVITHHSGYRTLYGHMSVVRVRSGAYVGNGERIGDVGSTGMSTGPHLHFTVYKNCVTVNPRNLLR